MNRAREVCEKISYCDWETTNRPFCEQKKNSAAFGLKEGQERNCLKKLREYEEQLMM